MIATPKMIGIGDSTALSLLVWVVVSVTDSVTVGPVTVDPGIVSVTDSVTDGPVTDSVTVGLTKL